MKLFISYSGKDRCFATRIMDDLLRSGIEAYLFELRGKIGSDYKAEIASAIKESTCLCVIDSSNAREATEVKREVELAANLNLPSGVIPCYIESPKVLREKYPEYFPGYGAITGINFYPSDHFDSSEVYKSGINALCSLLGVEFASWSELPEASDFEKELAAISAKSETKDFLVSDYQNFRFAFGRQSLTSESRCQNIVDDCKKFGITTVALTISLAKLKSKGKDYPSALSLFSKLTESAPLDPRVWYGYSGTLFECGRFADSLWSIREAIKIIQNNPCNKKMQDHLREVLFKEIRILISLDALQDAKEKLKSLEPEPVSFEGLELSFRLAHCDGSLRKIEDAYEMLRRSYPVDSENYGFEKTEILGHTEMLLSDKYCSLKKYELAIKHIENAVNCCPDNICYRAKQACYKHLIGQLNIGEVQDVVSRVLPITPTEIYYYGLLSYLLGDREKSDIMYRQSKVSWPAYSQLFEQ